MPTTSPYLNLLPIIQYDGVAVRNLLNRFVFYDVVQQSGTLFEDYTVTGTERPEDVAYKFYGDPSYYWLILLANEMTDPFYDWIMSDEELLNLCDAREIDIHEIHHYEDEDGEKYHEQNATSTLNPITTHEDAIALNEEKREIKIIKNEFKAQIEKEIKLHIKGIKKKR